MLIKKQSVQNGTQNSVEPQKQLRRRKTEFFSLVSEPPS